MQQADALRRLQPGDRLGNGGLAQPQRTRRAGERSFPRHGGENRPAFEIR